MTTSDSFVLVRGHQFFWPELSLFWTRIPKNASTLIAVSILQSLGSPRLAGQSVHRALTPYRIESRFTSLQEPARFVALRNPQSRIASAFLNKIVNPNSQFGVKAISEIREIDVDDVRIRSNEIGITYREFVEWIVGLDPMKMDSHIRPQDLFIKGNEHTVIALVDSQGSVEKALNILGVQVSERGRKHASRRNMFLGHQHGHEENEFASRRSLNYLTSRETEELPFNFLVSVVDFSDVAYSLSRPSDHIRIMLNRKYHDDFVLIEKHFPATTAETQSKWVWRS